MNNHEEEILRGMYLANLEGADCEWPDCESPARELVMTTLQTWKLCVRHAVISRATPTECAAGDW